MFSSKSSLVPNMPPELVRCTWTSIKPGSKVLPAPSTTSARIFLGIGRGALLVDAVDLAVAHQHAAVLDDLAIAGEDARVANQKSAGALQGARTEASFLADVLFAVGLIAAHDRETARARPAPTACCAAEFSGPFPSGRAAPRERGPRTSVRSRAPTADGIVFIGQIVIAKENALETLHQVGRGNELPPASAPKPEEWRRGWWLRSETAWACRASESEWWLPAWCSSRRPESGRWRGRRRRRANRAQTAKANSAAWAWRT